MLGIELAISVNNFWSLTQHQQASFFLFRCFGQDCPDLFLGTFEQTDEHLKVKKKKKKKKNGTNQKQSDNLEKRQNVREFEDLGKHTQRADEN